MTDVLERLNSWRNYDAGHGNIFREAAEEIERLRGIIAAEPVAWRTFDGEGGYEYRSYEGNETYRDEYMARNGDKYAGWVEPLYVRTA